MWTTKRGTCNSIATPTRRRPRCRFRSDRSAWTASSKVNERLIQQGVQWVLMPSSGHVRIPTWEPCEVRVGDERREGSVWNLSLLGLYLAIDVPLPPVGEELDLTFTLTGDDRPLVCAARVAWQNPPSII